MKTYQDEKNFVDSFAKDCKEELKNNGKFGAEWNGITIIVTGMDNNNSSKVTIYQGTIDGVQFTGSITALKKRLNIQYTKEYNRHSESAKSANTRVAIKTDDELAASAKVADERIKQAVATLNKYANRYAIPFDTLVNDGYETTDNEGQNVSFSAYDMILAALKQERDAAKEEAERKEAEREEAAAKKEAQKAELLAKIQEASASGQMSLVIELSKELAKLK